MRDYLVDLAKLKGFEVALDEVGNVLISKGKPKICLQSHYDMVCLGDGSPVEIINDGLTLKAKNSTLGADNGVGVAMMIALLDEFDDLECLFTSDEEIGLIGARGLKLSIVSPYILNLDAEEDGAVYIGCAGGFEIVATKNVSAIEGDKKVAQSYLVENLPGGHSGIDIDKNIPNAIIQNLKFVKSQNGYLVSFDGGEKLNSIPKAASCEYIKTVHDDGLCDFLLSLPHGVIKQNVELGIPDLSVNLAKLHIDDSTIKVQMYARAMSLQSMKEFELQMIGLFEKNGFKVYTAGHYAPWEPVVNKFASGVRDIMQKHFPASEFKAIHAGLECGVLLEGMPEKLFASIGPNIHSPHTLEESVEIASIERTFEALREIVGGF